LKESIASGSKKSLSKVTYPFTLFVLFLICGISLPALSGLLVFPFSLFPPEWDLIYRLVLSTIFLLSAIVSLKVERLKKYWKVFFAFFIASFAINAQALSAYVNIQTTPVNSIAMSMLFSTVLVVIPIIVLTLISGDGLPTIFLQKGDLKQGIIIGLIAFFAFAIASIPIATYMFNGQNLSIGRVIPWIPAILIIVILNGIREELLYRGLFLKKYESIFRPIVSNMLQALIFSLSHTVAGRGAVAYTSFTLAFVFITFLLGLTLGYLMRRTDSLLGPVLFHAGTDIPIFMGIISNLS
jgi:membrane protease YdiL (CAAX protease family)